MNRVYSVLSILVLIFLTSCSSTIIKEELQIIPRSVWNAAKPKPFKSQIPERITLHHEGTIFNPEKESAAEHIKKVQTWGMGEERNWTDIPYHYMIDFNGNIFEGRNVFTQGETATDYNPDGHLLITCLGNFEEQKVTAKQYESMIHLIIHSIQKFNIDPELIKGHKDFTNTLCPGKDLYQYLENGQLIDDVKSRIK